MFEGVLQIIKQIIIFSLISFIFLELCPKEEYKKYINMFTGFVLIIIVLNPIAKLFDNNQNISSIIDEYFIANELKDMEFLFEDYDAMRVDLVVLEYRQKIVDTINSFVEEEQLLAESIEVTLDTDVNSENFLVVTSVVLDVSKKYDDSSVKIKEVVLEDNPVTESVEIINIKNKISQFYNVSLDNININK